jgi:hypothetical protein
MDEAQVPHEILDFGVCGPSYDPNHRLRNDGMEPVFTIREAFEPQGGLRKEPIVQSNTVEILQPIPMVA